MDGFGQNFNWHRDGEWGKGEPLIFWARSLQKPFFAKGPFFPKTDFPPVLGTFAELLGVNNLKAVRRRKMLAKQRHILRMLSVA